MDTLNCYYYDDYDDYDSVTIHFYSNFSYKLKYAR